ncbi:MAG: hypothetical protein EOM55_03750 [Clostridia bacterium]|nr:hypothetical protein [Clostridia bacterium]
MSKLDKNQNSRLLNKDCSKRYFPLRNILKLGLLIVALGGGLAPTEIQAATDTSSQTPAYSLPKAYNLLKEENRGKDIYSKEEIAKGRERANNFINYLSQVYEDEGKPKNSFGKINEIDFITYLFSHLYDSIGKFAEKLEWQKIKFSEYDLIYVNGELFNIIANYRDISKDLSDGYFYLNHRINNLESPSLFYGKDKTHEQIENDKYIASLLKDFIVSNEDLAFIYNEAKNYENNIPSNQIGNKENIISPEQAEKDRRFEKIAYNIHFMIGKENQHIIIYKYSTTEEKVFSINGVNKSSIKEKIVYSINDDVYYLYEKDGEELVRRYADPLQDVNVNGEKIKYSEVVKEKIYNSNFASSLQTEGTIPAELLLF